jgi:2-dehydropantoate 2-reductase
VDKRIAVLGSGANGSSIGADLVLSGFDVTLVEQWPAHVEKIRRDGLTIEMDSETVRVRPKSLHFCELATLRQHFDVVLLLMKAYDTRWACQLIEPYLARDGVIAGVQNGMTTSEIANIAGPDRTVGTVIEISSTMNQPGVVYRHANRERSWFAVEESLGETDKENVIADLLQHSGKVERVRDIASTKWMKLVSNTTVLVPTAIAGVSMFDAIDIFGLRDVMVRAGQEALDVGRSQGTPVIPIFGIEERELISSKSVVETLLETLYQKFVTPGATTTVLQDWSKGRRSEVDDINGEVVARGKKGRVSTPANSAIVEIAHRIEDGNLSPGIDAARALTRLVEAEAIGSAQK